MQDFRKLEVWKLARTHAASVYRSTAVFPREELFGLRAQMRRAAVSICTNIAEGCGRSGDGDFGRFLSVAMGSASELECETILALDLALIEAADHDRLIASVARIKRMLAGLMKTVRSQRPPRTDS
jgi:four helix bundle protein